MRTITLAKYAGFCFGVTRAVNTAYEQIEKFNKTNEKIYCLGKLIHNSDVVNELEKMGMITIYTIEDAPDNSNVLIRAHGEPQSTYIKAKEKNINIIDATCPLVEKVHKIAKEAELNSKALLVIGDPSHPEVKGILGSTLDVSFATEDKEKAKDFVAKYIKKGVMVVSQTTLIPKNYKEIKNYLSESFSSNLDFFDTICPATEQRQNAAAKLAAQSDIMVLVGDEESSNYRKLREICQKNCKKIVEYENFLLQDIPKSCKIGIAAGASTPESKIKEVIASMSETHVNKPEEMFDMQSYMDEIEKSLKLPGRNEVVDGSVVFVNNEYAVINLGCKKDGMLPVNEVVLEEGQGLKDVLKAGDSISAKVIKTDDGDGNILLSTRRLQSSENWDELATALENGDVVNVTIIREVKGGVIANYKEVSGFIPMSQLADHFVETAGEYIGKVLPVYVTKVDQKKNKAVFSHKSFLTGEKDKKLAEVWEQIHVGDVVEGTVMRFTEYGAFVDIGGIDGLLHISEISWGKLKHPEEVLEIGQTIDVKILSMNSEKGKISLGYKQNNPEPWSVIDEEYQVGQLVKGTVVQLKEYGAFVELAPGLDGLVHISEIAYKRVSKVGDELTVGQEVEAKILEIDKEKRRISLSIKATLPEPEVPEEVKEESKEEAEETAEE